jgi:nudix-type nucleoside diphosphatase (YffH/AdpP family)
MAKAVEVLDETVLSSGRFPLTRSRVEIVESDETKRRIVHEIYRHGAAAAVMLYDPTRRVVLLVKQFRLGVYFAYGGLDSLEAVAGMLDGDAPEACVRREAMEEAGVRVAEVRHVFTTITNPACMTETIACFLAPYGKDDIVAPGGGVDADEWIERVEMDFDEALRRVETGEIRDSKTVALIYCMRAKGIL